MNRMQNPDFDFSTLFFFLFRAGKKILPGLKVAWQPSPYHWIISNINQNLTYHLKLIKLRFKIVKAKSEAILPPYKGR